MKQLNSLKYGLLASAAIALVGCNNSSTSDPGTPPVQVTPPSAAFDVSVKTGTVPLDVTFTDNSVAGSSAITSWQWDFGNGVTSMEQSPTITFEGAGEFDVTLTVMTADGSDSETEADAVNVSAKTDGFFRPTETEVVSEDGLDVTVAKNELLVHFSEDVDQAGLDATVAKISELGLNLRSVADGLKLYQVSFSDTTNEEDVIADLEALDGVFHVDYNRQLEFSDTLKSNETGYAKYLRAIPGGVAPMIEDVSPPSAVSYTGSYWIDEIAAFAAWQTLSLESLDPSTISIVDSGIAASQTIMDEARLSRFDGPGNAITDDDTTIDHGTVVTGLAAGYQNVTGNRVQGVNEHSSVVHIDVGIPVAPFITDVVEGVETAIDEGGTVINVSIGDSTPRTASRTAKQNAARNWRASVQGSVNYARANDALLVFAAGNNGLKADDDYLPGSQVPETDNWESHAIIVAATDEDKHEACFSRMGDVVEIAAPGVGVKYADVTHSEHGTSFAAPMVTGAGGLIEAVNPDLSAQEIKHILVTTAQNEVELKTDAENRSNTDPHFSCPTEPPIAETWEAASAPPLLKLKGAVDTALLSKGITRNTLPATDLILDEMKDVDVDITLPDGGVTALDVVFLIDQSGSYGDDINTLQARANDIVDDLLARGIDVQFGVAGYADFPISPYGGSSDKAYVVHQPMTGVKADVLSGIDSLDMPLMYGADGPESQYEALFQVATGAGRDVNGDGDFDDSADLMPIDIGWRTGSLKVLLFATDADFHDSDVESAYPGEGRTNTIKTLKDENIIVFGLQSGSSSAAAAKMNEIATETDGQVFALSSSSSTIASAIALAIDNALADATITLDIIAGNAWVTGVTPAQHLNVSPGDTVTFTVSLKGLRSSSVDGLNYDVWAWAKADGSAIINRTQIPIDVDP